MLSTGSSLATAGYYQLSWQPGVAGSSNKSPVFELQESRDEQFQVARTIYRGSDRASVISGQADGHYFYRVRVIDSGKSDSAWSRAVAVSVKHHSLEKAWLFFAAGAFVFFITLLFILIQARHEGEI